MYTLYYFPYSQHARRVHALLEEANLPYVLEHVDMKTGQHMSPAFIALNPNHQIPVLVSGELKLPESNAILRFLCNKHRLSPWYSENPEARAVVDQWLDWNQIRLGPAVIDIVLNKVFLGANGDPAAITRGQRQIEMLSPILGKALEGRDFIAGTTPTIADLSIGSNITQLGFADAVPHVPAIESWYRRVCEIPGFHRSLPKA